MSAPKSSAAAKAASPPEQITLTSLTGKSKHNEVKTGVSIEDIDTLFKLWRKTNREDLDFPVEIPISSSAASSAVASPEETRKAFPASYDDMVLSPRPERDSEQLYWIDVLRPTRESLRVLQHLFLLHPLTVSECTERRESFHQKLDTFGHYKFIAYNEFNFLPNTNILSNIDLYILILRNVMITIHHSPTKSTTNCIKYFQTTPPALFPKEPIFSADWLAYTVLKYVMKDFIPMVEQLELEVEALNNIVLVLNASQPDEFIMRVTVARKRASQLDFQLENKKELLEYLVELKHSSYLDATDDDETRQYIMLKSAAKANVFHIPNQLFPLKMHHEMKVYFRDILDEVDILKEKTEECLDTLSEVSNTYVGRMNFDVSTNSLKITKTVQIFVVLSLVFLPLTFVTSMWGQNTGAPGGENDPPIAWFFGILGGCVVLAVTMSLLFWRWKWF